MPDRQLPILFPSRRLASEMYEHRTRVQEQLADYERVFQRFRDDMRDRFAAHEAAVNRRSFRESLGGAVVVGFAVLGLILTALELRSEVRGTVGEVEQKVQARLDEEFGTPQIRQTIADKAVVAAEAVATERLQPQVAEARALVEALQVDTRLALEPIERLRQVLELQGQAADFSRSAYDKLRETGETADDPTVRSLANGARQMIDGAFAFTKWTGDLEVRKSDGTLVKFSEIDTDVLIELLESPQAHLRGRAAMVLGDRKERRAVARLAKLIQPDGETHLLALKAEISALREIEPDVPESGRFDWRPAAAWWKSNAGAFNESP